MCFGKKQIFLPPIRSAQRRGCTIQICDFNEMFFLDVFHLPCSIIPCSVGQDRASRTRSLLNKAPSRTISALTELWRQHFSDTHVSVSKEKRNKQISPNVPSFI